VKSVVVAFAFGVPNTLPSNCLIARIAGQKAKSLGAPVYTQRDVVPLPSGIELALTEEDYPKRVPTLRIARGAIRWAKQYGVEEIWLCAAAPHLARAARDLKYALGEADTCMTVDICEEIYEYPENEHWFFAGSAQIDTRFPLLWKVRDAILLAVPFWLYARIAS
jgi:hypothetical protein